MTFFKPTKTRRVLRLMKNKVNKAPGFVKPGIVYVIKVLIILSLIVCASLCTLALVVQYYFYAHQNVLTFETCSLVFRTTKKR